MTQTETHNFASPVDTGTYGEYRINRAPGDERPVYRFAGRISTDGSTPFAAEPGRYHVYAGWFCPWAQRNVIAIGLAGLNDVIGVSYVDGARDARGWAFRESNGPDPVNGFTLLRDAYEATEPGFDGHVSVPTLWDTSTHRIASNDFATLDIDLATQFARFANNGHELYPADLRAEIDELDAWLQPAVNHKAHLATSDSPEAEEALHTTTRAFAKLDERLRSSRYLLGDRITLADTRLWVTLVRYDAAAEASGRAFRLSVYPALWAYARELYQLPAFRDTTKFESFGGSEAVAEAWRAHSDRSRLGAGSTGIEEVR